MKPRTPFPAAALEIGICVGVGSALAGSFLIRELASLEVDQTFNLLEAFLWMTIAAAFFVRLRRQKDHRDLARAAAVAFLLFGISDLIEIQTRAWYQPIGLFLLKAACVVTFLICFALYRKRTKKV